MEIQKSRKRLYRVFSLKGDLDTPACIELKNYLLDSITGESYNICLDLDETRRIEPAGLKLIQNVQKKLSECGRHLATYGANEGVLANLREAAFTPPVTHFKNYDDFEDTFTRSQRETRARYFEIAQGDGPLRSLTLQCPICGTSEIPGYLCNEELHELVWKSSEITPQWAYKGDPLNAVDMDLYEIAICHKCYFASNRMDHFTVMLPEGTIASTLTKEQKDLLGRKHSQRSSLITEARLENPGHFFAIPREKQAGFLAWQLYEITVRNLAKGKANTDTLEVSRANILSGKFSGDRSDMVKFFSSAHVWLTDIVLNPDGHATSEIIMAYTYLVSVCLALDKVKEAEDFCIAMKKEYGTHENYAFWVHRVRDLIEEVNEEAE